MYVTHTYGAASIDTMMTRQPKCLSSEKNGILCRGDSVCRLWMDYQIKEGWILE